MNFLAPAPERENRRFIFTVGIPGTVGALLFDIDYMVLDKLASGYGDTALAAIGIVLKAERFPQQVGIGLCQSMVPLIAYSWALKDYKRVKEIMACILKVGFARDAGDRDQFSANPLHGRGHHVLLLLRGVSVPGLRQREGLFLAGGHTLGCTEHPDALYPAPFSWDVRSCLVPVHLRHAHRRDLLFVSLAVYEDLGAAARRILKWVLIQIMACRKKGSTIYE